MRVLQVDKLVEIQSQRHRERLLSQFSRLLDSSPSFVTYYSIDGVNSTAEIGTRDIMEYVGSNSPVRFKRVEGLPLYSVNAITAEITYDEDLGSYTEFSDEALTLNSVITPYPGDHFIIPDFNPNIIFVITEVKHRAIRGEDHRVVSYSVVPTSRILNIEKQVVEEYKAIFRNIGTEDKVLIKTEDYNILADYMEVYRNIHQSYLDEYYDSGIGYIKTPEHIEPIKSHATCKYLINFLMENRVCYFDEVIESIFVFEVVLPFEARHNRIYSRLFPLKRFLRKSVPEASVYITYKALPVSLFSQYTEERHDQSVEFKYIDKNEVYEPGCYEIMLYSNEYISNINEKNYDDMTHLEMLVAKFLNDEEITLTEYEDLLDDFDSSDLFRMYFIPLVLIMIKIKIKSLQTTGTVK